MNKSSAKVLGALIRLAAFGMVLSATGCGVTPSGAVVGEPGDYNYSPSVIQTGNLQQFWWCAGGYNPINLQEFSDTILYESIDLSTHMSYGPVTVLAETPHAWDSEYTCNPKVVRGVFANPVADGQTYTYAMYYVATSSAGVDNSIGVAFSNDGISWHKYPEPVILSTSLTGYGVGQPAVYNSDHKAGIWMFYEDDTPTTHHVEAISTDGIHFTAQGTLSDNGLDPNNPQPTWGDMAYDPETGYWYAAFNLPWRNPATTGEIVEHGQYGLELYRIPGSSLLTGTTPWQQLMMVDTNLTGYESNFIPGLLRDMYGNLNVVGSYPTIQMYTSMSTPQPAWNASPTQAGWSGRVSTWEIGSAAWTPTTPSVPFNRYTNGTVDEVTTGWVDPNGGFHLESTLGHLFQAPQQGATVPFYGCKNGSTDYFISLDSACEGQRILGTNGYGYSQSMAGLNLVALYRCYTGHSHFVSKDPGCEGQTAQELLGYVLP